MSKFANAKSLITKIAVIALAITVAITVIGWLCHAHIRLVWVVVALVLLKWRKPVFDFVLTFVLTLFKGWTKA